MVTPIRVAGLVVKSLTNYGAVNACSLKLMLLGTNRNWAGFCSFRRERTGRCGR